MGGPSSSKILPSLQVFSTKSSSSTLLLMKFKALIHALVFSHVCRFTRAISKAVSTLTQSLKHNYHQPSITFKKNKKNNNILFGSFRLHYNWCSSSHVMPEPHFYYDSTSNFVVSDAAAIENPQLSGYLQWLDERKVCVNSDADTDTDANEIDKLAEMFIANCHEQFRLEKQESYRKFQEMMARSM